MKGNSYQKFCILCHVMIDLIPRRVAREATHFKQIRVTEKIIEKIIIKVKI